MVPLEELPSREGLYFWQGWSALEVACHEASTSFQPKQLYWSRALGTPKPQQSSAPGNSPYYSFLSLSLSNPFFLSPLSLHCLIEVAPQHQEQQGLELKSTLCIVSTQMGSLLLDGPFSSNKVFRQLAPAPGGGQTQLTLSFPVYEVVGKAEACNFIAS